MKTKLKNRGKIAVFIVLIGLLGITMLFAIAQGSVKIPVSDVYRILIKNSDLSNIRPSHVFIVQEVRMPRILLAAIVGGTLSVIGASFQAIFKNPMADPYIMGVSSGAAFGATLGIVFGLGVSFAGLNMISFMAFLGALLTVLLVYTLARTGTKISVMSILLAGIVMNALLSAFISLIMIMFHNDIDKIVTWTMGSFNGASWEHVRLILVPSIFGIAYLLSQSRALNAMTMGEDEAKSLGVDVETLKKVTLVISSFLAAFAVSVSGIIGFVGLIVPHLFRMIFGPDHKVLIPVSFFGGALFLLICDTLARSIVPNMEIPVGIITAVFGGPFFLFLLQKHKKKLV